MGTGKVTFDVAGALIEKDGAYLVCRRKDDDRFGSLWEFPGGKIEDGETGEEAIMREMKEEIDVEIEVKGMVNTFEDEITDMKIHVFLYSASIVNGTPRCVECQDLRWVTLEGMGVSIWLLLTEKYLLIFPR